MAYKGHALKLGATWIGGILQQTFENTTEMQTEPTAGSPYPQQTSITNIKAGFRFRSTNVAAALGVLGFLGVPLASGGTTAELYEIQYGDDGFIVSGSNHRKIAIATGRAIWRTIQCQNGQDAEIEIMCMGLSNNGTASSVAYTENIAFPTPVDAARHTLMDATLANIAMGCILNVQIDSGLQIQSAPCASNVFDTRIDLKSIVPKIRVTTLNTALVGSSAGKIPETGAAATHANTTVRFRKRIAGTGTFVLNATAEHIVITSAGMVVPTSGFDAQRNEDGQSTFELTSTFDGTNLPLVISAASALA
jgi:hypothetical protein